ncbi:MAG: glycerate kinase [Eggerthellaceae bacterium]|jgi:glycerate kinase
MADAREPNEATHLPRSSHRGASDGAHPVFLFASDSFKGTLSSQRIAQLLTEEAQALFPHVECRILEIADGGEGTAASVVSQAGGKMVPVRVQGPLAVSVEAQYGLLENGSVILDSASASGLPLVPPAERNPLQTSTYGTGQLIRAALDADARDIAIGLGGTATVDGGMGMLAALGVRFWDNGMWEVPSCGGNLEDVSRIDMSGLDPRIRECRVRALCDVDNPLLGPRGAATVFGPQKGADSAGVATLEKGMRKYAQVIERATGIPVSDMPGAGAAGGLGAACASVLGAELVPGIECVLDLIHFDEALTGVDLCITGEGRLDEQTLSGKAVSGIARRCMEAGVACAAIVGSRSAAVTDEDLENAGIAFAVSTGADGRGWDEIRAHAEESYRCAAKELFTCWNSR